MNSREITFHKYFQFQAWSNATVSIAPGQTQQLSLQSIYGSIVPERLAVFARQQVATLANPAVIPRCWLPLTDATTSVPSINLQFCNQTVLQNVCLRDLYAMTVRNGYTNISYEQFIGKNMTYDISAGGLSNANTLIGGGPILFINPEEDFQLARLGVCNGTKYSWSLSGNIPFYNNQYATLPAVELVVVALYPGWLRAGVDGLIHQEIGRLTPEECRAVFESGMHGVSSSSLRENRENGYTGAGLFDKLRRVYDVATKVGKIGLEHAGDIKRAVDVGRSVYGAVKGGGMLNTSKSALARKYLHDY